MAEERVLLRPVLQLPLALGADEYLQQVLEDIEELGDLPAYRATLETADGDLTEEARIKRAAASAGSESPWIVDADWAKLRSLSVQFEFPEAWARTLRTSSMRLRVAGENLALWTTYDGTDPEASFAGPDPLNRAQLWTIPPARRVLATLSVTF